MAPRRMGSVGCGAAERRSWEARDREARSTLVDGESEYTSAESDAETRTSRTEVARSEVLSSVAESDVGPRRR